MPERLTDRSIAKLKPSPGRSIHVFNSECVGLAVRVLPSGVKSFTFDWRKDGRHRRVTLGRFPTWSVGKARLQASKLRLKVDVGENPAPARGNRVADLAETWKDVVNLTRRPGTAKAYVRLLDRHIVPRFGALEPRGVSRNMVEVWRARSRRRHRRGRWGTGDPLGL